MKTTSIFIVAMAVTFTNVAQGINWESVKTDQKHIIHANVGWDYAATYGVGYSFLMHTKFKQALTAQFSAPAGNNIWDDLKAEGTYQVRLVNWKSVNISATATANFRRYESDYLRTNSFGGKFTAVAGYYRTKWFAGAEFGFDKAIATHIANGKAYLDIYPDAVNGWYVPTGGNFIYGIQTGYTIKNLDVILRAGKLISQNFDDAPLIPYYIQLGVNKRF